MGQAVEMRLGPARFTSGPGLGFIFLAFGTVFALMASDPLSRCIGVVFAVVGALVFVWMLFGYEVLESDGRTLRVSAQLGSTTLASREFLLTDVSDLRVARIVFHRPKAASGLPGESVWYGSSHVIEFDYRGERFAFGAALQNRSDAAACVESLAAAGVGTDKPVAGG